MRTHGLLAAALAALCAAAAGCSRQAPATQAAAPSGERRFPLSGEVLSADRARKVLVVRHNEIAGYMPAMTMEFAVSQGDASVARPGERIRGELVVDRAGGARLFDRVTRLTRSEQGRALAVSLVAVGEAFTKIASDPDKYRSFDPTDLPSQRLMTLVVEHRLSICWAGHEGRGGGPRILELASKVLARAPGVGVADALIVACAIACRTTKRLYTTDAQLIRNPELRKLGRLGGRNWEIAEAP